MPGGFLLSGRNGPRFIRNRSSLPVRACTPNSRRRRSMMVPPCAVSACRICRATTAKSPGVRPVSSASSAGASVPKNRRKALAARIVPSGRKSSLNTNRRSAAGSSRCARGWLPRPPATDDGRARSASRSPAPLPSCALPSIGRTTANRPRRTAARCRARAPSAKASAIAASGAADPARQQVRRTLDLERPGRARGRGDGRGRSLPVPGGAGEQQRHVARAGRGKAIDQRPDRWLGLEQIEIEVMADRRRQRAAAQRPDQRFGRSRPAIGFARQLRRARRDAEHGGGLGRRIEQAIEAGRWLDPLPRARYAPAFAARRRATAGRASARSSSGGGSPDRHCRSHWSSR